MQTVYLSTALERFYPDVFRSIKRTAQASKARVESVEGLKNIWIRDWAPIKTTNYGFVKFKYELRWGASMRIPVKCWRKLVQSHINLDGGNVEQSGSKVLMTEMVFKRNPGQSHSYLVKYLESIFKKEIIFLPPEPGDTLGHIDGMARFVDENTVLINDTSDMKDKASLRHQEMIEGILDKAGLKVRHLPFAYNECPSMSLGRFRRKYPHGDDYNPAVGYYINFLKLENVVMVPQFGFEKDLESVRVLEKMFKDRTVVGIGCFDLAMTGGLLNCVTWEN